MQKPKTVKCPTCGKPVAWTAANRWRPFCSERCKLIDLGDWFEERNRIPDDDNRKEH
ncbi:MAG TPA: DNA gyrase inhibitor YacG [Gammaproteobacteria bacterium]|nr:DNA gyrase inhibitor YacG [Gammaproteobacteria bacterium]